MRSRPMFAVASAAALIGAGLVAFPGIGAEDLPSFEAAAAFPDTIDGVPLAQAPPRAVVTVDRAALTALAGDEVSTTHTDEGSVSARALSGSEVDLDAATLGEGDRELLESLGLLDPDEHPVAPPPPDLDDDEAAELLTALVSDHLDVEVQAEPIIDEWFAIDGTTAAGLEELEVIVTAEEPTLGMIFGDPAGEPLFGDQWGLHNTGQEIGGQAGAAGLDIDWLDAIGEASGEGVTVAVIDTPFDTTHPDLAGRFVAGWNYVNKSSNVSASTSAADHGTHVAGTIAALINGTGVAGIAPGARIMPLVVAADGTSSFTMDRVAQAVRFAVDNGADIINASLGTAPQTSWPSNDAFGGLRSAIQYAGDEGVPVIIAAGNQGADIDVNPVYPASYAHDGRLDNVLAVGAMDNRGTPWIGNRGGSNVGARTIGLTAPGARVLSTLPGNRYGFFSGTSMAAPHVAGVAALLVERQPALSASAVVDHLIDHGVTLTAWISRTTSGNRVSAAGALGVGADPVVAFSGLSGQARVGESTAEVATSLMVTAPGGQQIDAATVSLVAHVGGQLYAVVDHPMTTDAGMVAGSDDDPPPAAQLSGTSHQTDQEGSITTALAGGSTTLNVELPPGDYAWVVEFDDESVGAYLAAFRVTQQTAPPDGGSGDGGSGGGGSGDGGSDGGGSDGGGSDGGGSDGGGDSSTSPPPADDDSGGSDSTAPPPDGGGGGSTTPPPGDADDGSGGGSSTPPPSGSGGDGPQDDSGGSESGSTPPDESGDDPPQGGGGSSPPPSSDDGGSNDSGNGGGGGSSTDGDSSTSSRIRPNEGRVDTLVDIHGDWPEQVRVRFGGEGAYVSTVIAGVLVSVKAPPMASAGPVDVEVLTMGSEVLEVFEDGFTYLEGGGGGSTSPPPTGGGGDSGGDSGSTTPPPTGGGGDSGSTTPPPTGGGGDSGSTTPPPTGGGGDSGGDSGSTTPPPTGGGGDSGGDSGSTTPPPPDSGDDDGGGSIPPPESPSGDEDNAPGPRTVGGVRTVNGLSGVSLGSGHPAHELPSVVWPPACTTTCPAIRAVS